MSDPENAKTHAPVQERSRRTQQDLLDGLVRLLRKRTIGELTVSEIAAEAGLTTGAIYRRFKDKQSMVNAALEQSLSQTTEVAENKFADRAGAGQFTDRQLVEFSVREALIVTANNIPLMRAANSFNEPYPYEVMKDARNVAADWLVSKLSAPQYSGDELRKRARFGMRIATAAFRDTYLYGPGARTLGTDGQSDIASDKHAEQLLTDISQMLCDYLGIR